MAIIYIDDTPYEAPDGQNLLKVCLGLGFNIPYFCWHPALGSVGACRLCAVKQFRDENDKLGRIVMSCMTPATDGIRISIDDVEVRDFRKHVIEWLMINHPHDCPVCDEGGECHLQDMTLMTGHAYRRFRFKKRTHRNQYLGPLINHEMNRCIQCYRCVRFYKDFAGGDDLDVFGAHDQVYFGRAEDGILQSEFSGNLAEVCPTGVFTDKTYKQHYTRKWDLQNAPSICHHCSLGCNIIASERYGTLRRVQSRYNADVNGYFICDRGRFGYEHVNSDKRLRTPQIRDGENAGAVSAGMAVEKARLLISEAKRVIGIGSGRACLESNYALMKFVGEENFFVGAPQSELDLVRTSIELLRRGPARTPSLREVERHDAVLILGEDVTNTAPMMDLALRQAAKQAPRQQAAKLKIPEWDAYSVMYATQEINGPFYVATPAATKLDKIATGVFRGAPRDIAGLGLAIAECIRGNGSQNSLAEKIARDLLSAQHPVIVSGPSLGSLEIMQAAASISAALHEKGVACSLSFTSFECNSVGIAMLSSRGLSENLFSSLSSDDALIVLENDLQRRLSPADFSRVTNSGCQIIVIDHYAHELALHAAVTLPSGAFAESDGTLVNNEGRAQRFFQSYVPTGEVRESWRWIGELANVQWASLDDVIADLAEDHHELTAITEAAPTADFRIANQSIARAPHRYSGRTAMNANVSVHEPKPPMDPDSPLGFTMEGFQGIVPGAIVPFFWSPGWNSQSAINKYQIEIGGPLHEGDAGKRLIEPGDGAASLKNDPIEASTASASAEGLLLVPLYHIFGSDELSRMAPALGELVVKPSIFLNAEEAEKVSLVEGDDVLVRIGDREMHLPLVVREEMPSGVIGYSAGYIETAGIVPLSMAEIAKGSTS